MDVKWINSEEDVIIIAEDEIVFYGHSNILSLHPRTIEITKRHDLSLRGDCIIGVAANKSCRDLNEKVRTELKQVGAEVKMEIIVEDKSFHLDGLGAPHLSLLDEHDIVIRKSTFVCPRTLAINSSHASSDIPRSIIELLHEPDIKAIFRIMVQS
jgi:uncharacterized protein